MEQNKKRVAIVGGGIGGLFLANALVRNGLDVKVYEQADALSEVGAGVMVTPNSARQLDRLGLGDALRKSGALLCNSSEYLRHDGTQIAPLQVTDSSGSQAVYGMHRADLVDLLAEPLSSDIVQTGHKCIGFSQDENIARLEFANGKKVEADLVVAADGIHSQLRPHVTDSPDPVFSGRSVYRGTVPSELVPWWPSNTWQMWLGEKKHFLVFPLRGGELINYVGFVPADSAIKESWVAEGDPDTLRAEFAGWDERIGRLLGHVDTTFRWALYDREPLKVWTKGRLTLLGDAAHAMLPHLGQGANQSMEDGMALATLLTKTQLDDFPAALQAYEKLRLPRVAEVQQGSRQNGLRYDSRYSDLGLRDEELKAHSEYRKWLYDYDVLPIAESISFDSATVK